MANQVVGVIGLGRMGMQIARRLKKKGHQVIAWNRSPKPRQAFRKFGGQDADTIPELVSRLKPPRILWVMLPAGKTTENMLLGKTGLLRLLQKNDIVIDGGNAFYRDSIRRAKAFAKKGIYFFDAGTSGGIHGEKNGFSIMVGGPKKNWPKVKAIFQDLAAGEGKNFGLVGINGAGHLVKMVHNGIEYGMMEAIGEGFAVLEASGFKLDFAQVARIWSRGSVVSSWLIELTKNIFQTENLNKVVGLIPHTGEGQWTIATAKKFGVPVPIIEKSFSVRRASMRKKNQKSFSNKIVALLRKQFGGHEVTYKK